MYLPAIEMVNEFVHKKELAMTQSLNKRYTWSWIGWATGKL